MKSIGIAVANVANVNANTRQHFPTVVPSPIPHIHCDAVRAGVKPFSLPFEKQIENDREVWNRGSGVCDAWGWKRYAGTRGGARHSGKVCRKYASAIGLAKTTESLSERTIYFSIFR